MSQHSDQNSNLAPHDYKSEMLPLSLNFNSNVLHVILVLFILFMWPSHLNLYLLTTLTNSETHFLCLTSNWLTSVISCRASNAAYQSLMGKTCCSISRIIRCTGVTHMLRTGNSYLTFSDILPTSCCSRLPPRRCTTTRPCMRPKFETFRVIKLATVTYKWTLKLLKQRIWILST